MLEYLIHNIFKMRLVGYIKEHHKNYFAKPVYSNNGTNYYFHKLDKSYFINGFSEVQTNITTIKKIYLSKNFELASKGAIVFVGSKKYIKYDSADYAIDEILNYITDNSEGIESFQLLLKQAQNLKKNIYSERFKSLKSILKKSNKEEDNFILSFDLPITEKRQLEKPKEGLKLEFDNESKHKSNLIKQQAVERNYEAALRSRADERRSKLKLFNYQFKNSKKT